MFLNSQEVIMLAQIINKMSRKGSGLSSDFMLPVFLLISIISMFGIDAKSCVSTNNCCI